MCVVGELHTPSFQLGHEAYAERGEMKVDVHFDTKRSRDGTHLLKERPSCPSMRSPSSLRVLSHCLSSFVPSQVSKCASYVVTPP